MSERDILEIGGTVRYKSEFLRNIGVHTGDMPHAKGTVRRFQNIGITLCAVILWDNPDIPSTVNVKNLERI